MERLQHNHQDDTSELLSAFVDGEADLIERRRAETQIAQCAACAQDARELRAFTSLMRDVPLIQPKRSFTLDPASVAPRRQLFPIFRWATVVSTVLLFIVLGADLIGPRGASSPSSAIRAADESSGGTTAQIGPMERSGASASQAAAASEAAASTAAETFKDQSQASAEASTEAATAFEAVEASEEAAVAALEASDEAAASAAEASAAPPPPAAALAAPSAAATAQAATAADQSAEAAAATGALASDAAASAADSAGGSEQLEADQPAGADTTNLAPAPASTPAWSSLQIAQIILAVAAISFGAATWWAWRRRL